ncbi:MAG TPA: hypothetical protein VMR50_18785 [Myxococcota bacterium]|nr:hypothetical protein [Myxococcota bacterium]
MKLGRLFGLVLLVLGVWAGAEIFNNGFDGAFGGLLARLSGSTPTEATQGSLAKRIGAKVQSELNDASQRRMGDEDQSPHGGSD